MGRYIKRYETAVKRTMKKLVAAEKEANKLNSSESLELDSLYEKLREVTIDLEAAYGRQYITLRKCRACKSAHGIDSPEYKAVVKTARRLGLTLKEIEEYVFSV